ncbi:recombination mediator RecR [Hippea alviniae]|uniref:recombination mediator RecR n=1 Tax=Hippea alviniae TaxID=1279027 RepID=UPI0003B36E3E|nr:recombination mediator RecR [Hippea alviniae]
MKEKNLVETVALYLSQIPGIGEKNSKRYALWLAEHKDNLNKLIDSLSELSKNINICKKCFNITTNPDGICDICNDDTRDKTTICVVETIENLVEIELSDVYNGSYFVLGGVISPIYDIDNTIKRIEYLAKRVQEEGIKELILVLSSTTEGELTMQYIKEKLKETGVKITKVASGIPIGANINYIDQKTLIEAFKSRVVA